MSLPWNVVDRVSTKDGWLELRRRGSDDVLLTIDNRILMSSHANRSEMALAQMACAGLADRKRPRVLIGGLGLGYTLRAALDSLPRSATVVVAELNRDIARWCGTELAPLIGGALDDPRVDLRLEDVTRVIDVAARSQQSFDAILLDLYTGPGPETDLRHDRLYGDPMLRRAHAVLPPGGIFAVWAEQTFPPYAAHLRRRGFRVRAARPGRGGLRHAVYLAEKQAADPFAALDPRRGSASVGAAKKRHHKGTATRRGRDRAAR